MPAESYRGNRCSNFTAEDLLSAAQNIWRRSTVASACRGVPGMGHPALVVLHLKYFPSKVLTFAVSIPAHLHVLLTYFYRTPLKGARTQSLPRNPLPYLLVIDLWVSAHVHRPRAPSRARNITVRSTLTRWVKHIVNQTVSGGGAHCVTFIGQHSFIIL